MPGTSTRPESRAGWPATYFFGYAAAGAGAGEPDGSHRTHASCSRPAGAIGGGRRTGLCPRGPHDLPSATLWWALAGVSMAGVYMPGAASHHRSPRAARPAQRAVPYYTASFWNRKQRCRSSSRGAVVGATGRCARPAFIGRRRRVRGSDRSTDARDGPASRGKAGAPTAGRARFDVRGGAAQSCGVALCC